MDQILNIIEIVGVVILGLILFSPFLAGAIYITIHIIKDISKALREE